MITKVENVNKDSAFYQCMYGICDDVTQADEVVKLLEGISSSEPMPYPREFCISYVIKLLKKYCSADECELALARYGFLDGFERKKYKRTGERTEEYWKYARRYNQHEFISSNWTTTGTALTKLRDRHMIIVGNLDEITSQIKSANADKLGLIEEVPKELNFPKPRDIEESPNNPLLPEKGEPIEPTKVFTKILEKIKLFIEWLKKFIDPKDTIKILLFSFMAMMLVKIARFLENSQSPQQYVETTSDTAIEENGSPMITAIRILNAGITLTPDRTWEELEVVIYPREANIDDVQYGSENTHLVVVDRSEEVVVRLASEWQREIERSTKVHAQFREIDEKISVIIQENTADSEASNLDDSILDGDDSVNTENIPGY